jgi:hypothetical protein
MAFVVSRIDSVLQVCNQTLLSEFQKWLQSIPFIVNGSIQQKMFTCAGYSL